MDSFNLFFILAFEFLIHKKHLYGNFKHYFRDSI
jgi:hypothetical protein